MLNVPQEWFWPYVASNLTALALVVIAWKWPAVAKWLFAVMFLGACYANTTLVLRNPDEYQGYDKFVLLGMYHRFITGYFAEHTQPIVLTIAFGQLVIGLLLCTRRLLARIGVLGAAIFLVAIIPLGVGSAFPFSLICLGALWLVDMHLRTAAASTRANRHSNSALVH